MQVRKLGWLVVAGGLPAAALLVSTLLAAQSPGAGGRIDVASTGTPPAIDSVVVPIGSGGPGTGAPQDPDGMLLQVQSGGWGSPGHNNSNWGNSNNNWHGGGWPVVCQSSNNRRRTCNKPSNQTVRIERQLSNTRCTQGVNWGQNRNQIWVDNGCSARFVPTGNWNGGGGGNWNGGGGGNWNGGGSNNWNRAEVTCESRNFRQNQCNWPSNWGTPQLVQQISQVRCVRDRTWGHNRNRGHIWVNEGCAARFRAR